MVYKPLYFFIQKIKKIEIKTIQFDCFLLNLLRDDKYLKQFFSLFDIYPLSKICDSNYDLHAKSKNISPFFT